MIVLLLFVFMVSGAAGLFYESVWSRYLSLFVGHSAYAQVITLVLFLGGMAVGALLVSRRTHRIRDPLYAYAIVELVVGLLGMVFHDWIYLPVTGWAYDSLFPALAGGTGLTVVKWSLAGALILPQSILLGATFPLMSAGVLRRAPSEPGRVLASLYFANSFGAAVGVLLAGFVFFQMVGLPGTLQAAAILNLLVALAGIVISRLRPIPGAATAPVPVPAPAPAAAPGDPVLPMPTLTLLLLGISAGTAVASFIYEIAWIRMLSLVIGSATHSFELMLSAFILGLALGAWWIRRRADRLRRPLRTLGIVQLWMGAFALLSLVIYSSSFTWVGTLLAMVARTNEGYAAFSIAKYAICLIIMLPATFCAGITLPLITRALLAAGSGEQVIGRVYAVNTFGSIIGVALAGLVLLPMLGLKGVLILGGVLDMALGVVILGVLAMAGGGRPAWRPALVALAVTLVLQVTVTLGVRLDPVRMSSAVFRQGAASLRSDRRMLYHADGRTATVHAFQGGASGPRIISTNGKPDGSLDQVWFQACSPGTQRVAIIGDDATQMMLGVIPLAFRPAARSVAVIGHGTGMTSHFLLASPTLEEVVTIEIEPRMVEGSRIFEPANRRVFTDPRSLRVFDDAKSYFAATNRQFDIILSEPSNPWVSGVSGLFTQEFYERVKRYVAPGGIFGQWLHAYELSDPLVLSVLAAFDRTFADYRIYAVSSHDLLVVGVTEGAVGTPDWSVLRWPALEEDLCHFHQLTARDFDGALLADKAGLRHLLGTVRSVNSDFYPVLDLGAEHARFTQRAATGVMGLAGGVLPLALGPAVRPLGRDTALVTALATVDLPRWRAQGEWLRRTTWGARSGDSAAVGEGDEVVRLRHADFRRGLRSGEPPTSWGAWTPAFGMVTTELHAGTWGWADSTFFGEVEGFLDRARAPVEARAVVAFRKALAEGDLAAAAVPSGILLEAARQGQFWLPYEDLLDGIVTSRLAIGDAAGARAAWDLLRGRSVRRPDNARMLSLYARLGEAGAFTSSR